MAHRNISVEAFQPNHDSRQLCLLNILLNRFSSSVPEILNVSDLANMNA